jgi:hypothetical protein
MASETFVTIAGIVCKVLVQTAYIEPPEVIGQWRRLPVSNEAVNSERNPKRGYAFVAQFNPPADFATLQAVISEAGADGVPTPVMVESPSDGLTLGATLTAWVRLGRAQFHSRGAGASKTVHLTAPVTVREA